MSKNPETQTERPKNASFQNETGFTKFLKQFHTKFIMKRRVNVLAKKIAARLPENANIVDIGAGSGELAFELLALRPDIRISGFDIKKRRDAKIKIQTFDGKIIPKPDNAYDVAMLVDVVHHALNQQILLNEAMRLAPVVVVKDHICKTKTDKILLEIMDYVGNRGHEVACDCLYHSQESWKTLISQIDGKILESETGVGLYPFPVSLLFPKKLHVVLTIERKKSLTK